MRDDREGVGKRGDPDFLELACGHFVDPPGPTIGTLQRLVMRQHGDTVARDPDVELDAIAARNGDRRGERRDAVLRALTPIAAVCQSKHRSADLEVGADPEMVARVQGRVVGGRPVEDETSIGRPEGATDPDVVEAFRDPVGIHGRGL